MPWTIQDARQKNKGIRSDEEARMWVRVANRTLRAELDKKTPQEEAEARALEAANGVLKEMHRKGGPKKLSATIRRLTTLLFGGRSVKAKGRKPYVLHMPGTTGFLSLGLATTPSGVPVHRYRKEVIRCGEYIHPDTGQKFSVTPKTLAHWAATFRRMQGNGVTVTVPLKHENEDNPEKTLGTVDDLLVDGEGLVGVFSLVGDDAPRIAESNDVSLFVPPEFTDAKGNVYKHPIRHIAVTPVPVIPGLSKWETLAAAYTLKTESTVMPFDWKKLQADLGLETELTEANAGGLILSHVATLKKQKDEAAKPEDKPAPDPILLSLASENRAMKLAALVEAAKITPAVRDKLAAQYVDTKPLALALSRGGDNFDAVVAALAENDPVALGEKTGPQTLRLARNADGTEDNPMIRAAERRAAAAAKSA